MTEMHADDANAFGHGPDFERQTRRAGLVISAALIAGLVWWGGTLVLRDVTEVPVIEAKQAEFRTEPSDPGGQVAAHQGLAVTEVASQGTASADFDEVAIAPVEEEVELPEPGATAEVTAEDLRGDEAIDAAVTMALGDLVQGTDPSIAADERVVSVTDVVDEQPSTGMLRPRLRPANLQLASAAAPVAPQSDTDITIPRSATPLTGPMVQLGAYDSAAIAEDVRQRLYSRFGASLSGRPYFVMEAVVSGHTYHRLRVGGFDSRGDANRFCELMTAEGVDCIPVAG